MTQFATKHMLDLNHPRVRQLAHLLVGKLNRDDISETVWDELVVQATLHKVQANLAHELDFTAPANMAPRTLQVLKRQAKQVTLWHLLFRSQMQIVDEALCASGIQPVWIKGLAVAYSAYPAPQSRQMIDLDVLVPFDQRFEALACVRALGYAMPNPRETPQAVFPAAETSLQEARHDFYLVRRVGQANIVLELHYNLLRQDQIVMSAQTLAWLHEHTAEVVIHGRSYRTFEPEVHLLYLCAHAVVQHGAQSSLLRYYYDIHLMLASDRIHVERLLDRVQRLGWVDVTIYALEQIMDLFDTAQAGPILARLQELSTTTHTAYGASLQAQITHIMASDGAHFYMLQRTMASLSWRRRLDFIGLMVLPRRDYIAHRYQTSGQVATTFAYGRYWWDVINKYSHSLLVYLRKRSRLP